MKLAKSSIDDLPFILCPNLEAIKVNVILLWFKPKGGGRECPVVLLDNVPVGFDSVLEACNFLKRPEGWLIDVTDKDSLFWRRIFGDIEFTKRQPVKIYEPQKLILAPPPPSVVTVIRGYTDEHITYLTKHEGVTGTDAVRACKSDAMRGAVSSRGAWAVIKVAALDRLSKNPEDVSTFEYLWATAKAQNLNQDNIPASISHELLLRKIVERQRLTAQIESVLPSWFIRKAASNFIIKADWQQRYLFTTPEFGGPIDSKLFPEVEGLAQHLLDINCIPFNDQNLIATISKRIESENPIEHDWVDDLEIPETNTESFQLEMAEAQEFVNRFDHIEIFKILDRINLGIMRRVDYSKTICREIFCIVVSQQNIDIISPDFLKNLEELLGYFTNVTNFDSLKKVWNQNSERIQSLIRLIAVTNSARMKLLQIFSTVEKLDQFINKNIISIDNDPVYWWWNGYGFSRTPSISGWQIFKVDSSSSNPIGTGLYSSIQRASEDLYRIVMRSKVRLVKTAVKGSEQFYGFSARSGAILQLTPIHESSDPTFLASMESVPTRFSIPSLWKPKLPDLDCSAVMTMMKSIDICLGFTPGAALSEHHCKLETMNKEFLVMVDEKPICVVRPGFITYAWACLFTTYCTREFLNEDIEELIQLLIGSHHKSDIEIGLEDDLLDELESISGEIGARLGRSAVDVLRKAIQAPSELAEWQCYEYWVISRGQSSSERFDGLLRGILLLASQYRGYLKLSLASIEQMRLGVRREVLVCHAIMAYLWYRLRWANCYSDILQAVGISGDLPYGELFPSEVIQWNAFGKIEHLIGKVKDHLTLESTSREAEEFRDQSRGPSLLH
jgi:hypothetical protein